MCSKSVLVPLLIAQSSLETEGPGNPISTKKLNYVENCLVVLLASSWAFHLPLG